MRAVWWTDSMVNRLGGRGGLAHGGQIDGSSEERDSDAATVVGQPRRALPPSIPPPIDYSEL